MLIIFDIKMMLIETINKSFLLDNSQKIYLLEKIKNSDEIYRNRLLERLNFEKEFMLQLLKKYKDDSNDKSIWQLKWELIHKNFDRIRMLENEDKDDLFELEQKLEF